MNFRKINNITGWIVGAIAFIIYLKTMEPTVSFWDCGEFLSCAYKMEVGHAPGFPFLALLQRISALFAGGGVYTGAPSISDLHTFGAATCMNALSSVTCGLTIMFLFWVISYFGKRLTVPAGTEPDQTQTILIIGAALTGAFAYAFSDTFWFSAVEAIPWGASPFFTTFCFWAALKWEREADKKYADRWLVLISYVVGLSVCVHLIILLVIPSIAMVYYFKRYKATIIGGIIAFIVGTAVLVFVQFGIIQYIPKFSFYFDYFFTNSLGTHFDVGSLTFIVLVILMLITLLVIAKMRKIYVMQITALCTLFIIIGYSNYFMAVIRSRADVPVDMCSPDNPISFLDYVSREQFGQQPILFGPYFTSQYSDVDTSKKLYAVTTVNGKDHYKQVGKGQEPVYKGDQLHFFPRVYEGAEARHTNFYRMYCNLAEGEEPSSADNLHYFLGYQMDWMWWRFFMWNYAGRQNDIEGQCDPEGGNWVSGIPLIDNNLRGLGNTAKMGDGFDQGHTQLYLLPFILGIIGLVFQFNKNKKDGVIVLTLYFFTGAAIGIYLNMPPIQPRERDYAFSGCVGTFAIWIGLGVLMVAEWMRKAIKSGPAAVFTAIGLCFAAVPLLMAKEEWESHDRSKKTLARAMAYNTLNSCPQNAVLFTYGDNQTYPLWYAQEVEGFRKDVRIINTSLLGIGWYVDQLNYRVNDADAVPMLWKWDDYVGDHHNYISYYDTKQIPKDTYINLTEICNFMNSTDRSTQLQTTTGEFRNYMPTKNFFAPTLSKEELVKRGYVKVEDTGKIITDMKWVYPKNGATKSDLAVLNIIAAVANDGWKRPLCFDAGLRQGDYGGTADYMMLEGLVNRLVPFRYADSARNTREISGFINTDKSYDLFVHKFMWGGAERKDVYFDEPNRHELVTLRMNASQLANALVFEGKSEKADTVLNTAMANITEHSYPYDFYTFYLASSYFRVGIKVPDARKQGEKYGDKIVKNIFDNIDWIYSLPDNSKNALSEDINRDFQVMQSLYSISGQTGDTVYAKQVMDKMQKIYPRIKDQLKTRTPVNNKQEEEE